MSDQEVKQKLRAVELRNFWQGLSTKASGGLNNIPQALEDIANNELFDCGSLKPIIRQMAKQIQNGSSLSQTMKQAGIFSPQEVLWIATGEDRGALEAFIDDQMQERPVEDREAQLFTFWKYLARSLQFNGRIEDIFNNLRANYLVETLSLPMRLIASLTTSMKETVCFMDWKPMSML